MKWRLALINAAIPDASFYTIQFEDYSVMDYKEDLQHEFSKMNYHEALVNGKAGDAFGQWQERFEMPDWLKEQL